MSGWEGPLRIPYSQHLVVATFDYGSTDDTELSINEGDEILVMERHPSGWWTGQLNGKTGAFPSNYTKLIESREKLVLPKMAKIFLCALTTRVEGALSDDGTSVLFSVDFIPQSAWLQCSDEDVELAQQVHWKSSLKPFRASDAPPTSSEAVPWLPLDVLGIIFRMCGPGMRASLSLTCREFRRAAALMSAEVAGKTMSWTMRDEVDTLEGAFKLIREAPWFIGPQVVKQAEALLERLDCSPIGMACALHTVRETDLDALTDEEHKVLDKYREAASLRDANANELRVYADQMHDPGLILACSLLRAIIRS